MVDASVSSGGMALELLEALGSSLDIRVVLREAYPLLIRLVPADYGALGVSHSNKAEDFEWTVANLPSAFFFAYSDMAEHDFVRSSVAKHPNRVMLDEDMVPRRELEKNMMYRRAREVGAPIEQVMAVMLHVDDRWQGGLSLYRDRRRPFSREEQARLQQITPALANAVRNCHQFGLAQDWKLALERMLLAPGIATLLVGIDGTELARSDGATELMDNWFAPHELRSRRLPEAFNGVLDAAKKGSSSAIVRRQASGTLLEVSCVGLAGCFGAARWLLRLEERPEQANIPAHWCQLLTPREQQVSSGVLQGWDNRTIGQELGCAEATVKKHLQSIFEKLGLESRTQLIARASQKGHG